METWWFNSWAVVGQAVVTAAAGFAVLIAACRVFGKRATSRMNNFDWLVTVAVGSLFASVIILKDVSFVEGMSAVLMLLTLQWGVTFATSHWRWARWLFLSRPRVLYQDGAFDEAAMRQERVSPQEIRSAVRGQGVSNIAQVHAVVLESDSELAVIKSCEDGSCDLLEDVED